MNSYLAQDGRTFILRQPRASDAAHLIAYSKRVFASTDQLLTTTEEYTMTVEAETNWINSINYSPNSLLLIAVFEQSIVGFLFFIGNTKRKTRHTGEFGMSVHQDYRRLGLGQALVKALLNWAGKNALIEKLTLQVFLTNTPAIQLYEKMGFVEEGRLINAAKQENGDYTDIIQMYLFVQ